MEFSENMRRLIANWPMNVTRSHPLERELKSVFKEVGEERFTQATDSIIAHGQYQFFPTVAEFRGYIPAPKRKMFCGKCENGWIRVTDYEAMSLYEDKTATAMIRCECRRGPGFEKYERRVKAWIPAN